MESLARIQYSILPEEAIHAAKAATSPASNCVAEANGPIDLKKFAVEERVVEAAARHRRAGAVEDGVEAGPVGRGQHMGTAHNWYRVAAGRECVPGLASRRGIALTSPWAVDRASGDQFTPSPTIFPCVRRARQRAPRPEERFATAGSMGGKNAGLGGGMPTCSQTSLAAKVKTVCHRHSIDPRGDRRRIWPRTLVWKTRIVAVRSWGSRRALPCWHTLAIASLLPGLVTRTFTSRPGAWSGRI